MRLGIFAKTFQRPSLTQVIEAVVSYGFKTVQFNMACSGLPSMPDFIPEGLPQQIAAVLKAKKVKMAALSGTFNMVHPDKKLRQQGLTRLELLIKNARAMGTSNLTLCTGSYDPRDMWRFHPLNSSKEAWSTLGQTMESALKMAEAAAVNLLIEPELGNVVNSAAKARQLIDQIQSTHLKVVFDPANLFEVAAPEEIKKVINEGLDLLADHLEIAHAKDRNPDGTYTAAGAGVLPYPFFLKKLNEMGFEGDMIIHGLSEQLVAATSDFLQRQINESI